MTSLQASLLRGGRNVPSASSSSSIKDRSKPDDAQLPQAYQQECPSWRPPLHPGAADKDVPDLFPTKPNQPEDDMSQISVRKGFAARPYVRNESFSAHEMIYTRLAAPDTLPSLSLWMDEIMQRRSELDRNSVAPSPYKAPSRVTLNEAKLSNYVKDLADPNVPLMRLSRNVPHGFRGEKLFEMLWAGGALPPASNTTNAAYFTPRNAPSTMPPSSCVSTPSAASPRKSVDISRAVWFIRALGAAELSSLRNKSAATIVPEITFNLCTWMAKQVAELNLVQAPESSSTAAASPAPVSPSTYLPRTPGGSSSSLSRTVAAAHFARTPSNLNPVSSPSPAPAKEVCTVLQNEVDEERWIAKWSYSLSLARHLHAQNLLDRSVLVRWIVDAFAASNLVQLPFLVELVQEVLVFILRRRCFVKPFLMALLQQIPALDSRLDRGAGAGLRSKLVLLFRIVCESCPDALISPRLWSEHVATLTQLLNEMASDEETDMASLDANSNSLPVVDYVENAVKPRVNRLLLRSASRAPGDNDSSAGSPTTPLPSPDLQHHVDIQALDSFDMKTIDRVFLQPVPGSNGRVSKHHRDDAAWTSRIETILTWACTDRRIGVARQYLAATLIEKIRFGVQWEETSEGSDAISLPAFDMDHHGKKTRKVNVEPMLIKWLGDVEAALNLSSGDASRTSQTTLLAKVDVACIVVLVGDLARRTVFSYTKYLQRLIARGMTTAPSSTKKEDESDTSAPPPSASASRGSLHLRLLRSLPLYDQPASVYQQRRQAIYGDRTKETYEDAAQRRALRQLQAFLPFVFAEENGDHADGTTGSHAASATPSEPVPADLHASLSRLWSASRFVRCKIFRSDLLPAVSARIDHLNGDQLSQVSAVLVAADDFEGLAQLLATLLLRPLSDTLARAAFNMVIEYSIVWRVMDIMGTLNQLVRQQLNHSSSVRNDRQAVMASTTLLRLRTLIEGIPSRINAPAADIANEHDAVQAHVQALRPSVDALLERFAQRLASTAAAAAAAAANQADNNAATPAEGSDILTPFRNLYMQPDATSDEIIERTIVESVLERSSTALISAAVRLIDQLYLEASLEIDERHARWLAHLANSMEHTAHKESSIEALLGLLTRLVAHGTLNLQLAMDTFLLPYLLSSVRRMTDPATRGADTAYHLVAIVGSLKDMFASSIGGDSGAVATVSYEDMRAFGAQTMLLFAQVNLPSLLRTATCLICASDESSPLPSADKAQLQSFWRALLQSEPMQIAFRQDPRQSMLVIRDTSKSIWGCNPARVMELAMACLDATSLLLRDVSTVDAASVKARLDGWDTAVVANELVEIFERLQLVESSFQSRADSKTKALASGIFDDLFVRLPDIGAQLMRDCQSSGLIARFTDIGIKILSDKVKLRAEAMQSAAAAKNEGNGTAPGSDKADDKGESPLDGEVESVMRSVLRMCEQQDTFIFNATDADSCGQILLLVITALESALAANSSTPQTMENSTIARLSTLLHGSGLTFQLLHLVLRFGCTWNNSMKALALRLVKVLLELTRCAGEKAECGREFALLLDSLSFVLDEMPPALLGGCMAELETQLYQAGDLATTERSEKMQQLSFTLPLDGGAVTSMGAARERGWFVASSASAALKKGWFTPGGLNPWECAEYLEGPAPAAGAAGAAAAAATANNASRLAQNRPSSATAGSNSQAGSTSKEADSPGARLGWPTKLSLNTAIPLSMLGLRVTRDLVPHYASPVSPGGVSVASATTTGTTVGGADAATGATATTSAVESEDHESGASATLPLFVESERSYGERLAGESAFSRDLRRGLLIQPVLPKSPYMVEAKKGGETLLAAGGEAGAGGNVAVSGVGGSRIVGLSNDAIPVIDLTWDDDEVMLPAQGALQDGGAERPNSNSGNNSASRKRRMSKRD